MKVADLSPERRAWLLRARWDRIIEKHEGPEGWRWQLTYDGPAEERPEFLTLDGYEVLLPVAVAEHPKISVLWILPSEEGRILTIYLKNMQWAEWYVAILYHEIFLAPDLTPVRLPPWPPIEGEPGQDD